MRSKFKLNRVTVAVMIATASIVPAQHALAGAGFGDAYDLNNNPFIIQSYFATSPSGARLWTGVGAGGADTGIADPLTGAPAGYDPANRLAYQAAVAARFPNGYTGTGKAIRKFVDTLPLPAGHALASKFAANKTTLTDDASAAKYIPVAVPKKWVNPQGAVTSHDYYEIAAVEYSEKFHSDLRKASTLRGYVQVDQEASNGRGLLPGSKALALYYPNSSGKVAFAAGDTVPADAVPILIAGTDANGKLTGFKVPAKVVEAPHYLGPVLTASQNVPTRVKFLNLLPTGRAEISGTKTIAELDGTVRTVPNVVKRNGDIFLPLDPSVPGSGFGPDGAHTYSQNRVNMHLHGGDNPWISDGGPHTWITPGNEADPTVPGSIASLNAEPAAGPLDPSLVPDFLRGPGAVNVPDMNDPGPGAMTYYFPNGQSARMEWYHDHSVGVTRLNVYAGLASAYLLTDAKEQDLIARKVIPGPDDTIPLILQDKTFVPDDITLQDARWDTAAWGAPGDIWYPHVYETVQDPNQATNFNAVGRWHWGPWFWPSYPSAYNLPSGAYGDVTLTPEAWHDTPVVNGVAYPTITVEPKPYRMRILNASNDRTFAFNMFVADSSVTTDDGRTNTEMKMVPVNSWVNNTCADPAATRFDPITGCTPQSWSTDVYGHNGGVPDATTQGPTLYQIASEGGLLPGVAAKDPTPLQFLLDKGRAAVLNVDFGASGLLIGNGERADVVVDFSAYAGKTLLVYNDNGAPVPAADPRNEFFTGYGDNSATGGAEDTRPGYGPNSRTIMQIVVAPAAVTPATPLNVATLDAEVKAAFKATQETPVVAQSAYNGALGTTWSDTQSFAPIFVGSLKQPAFQFVPGTPNAAFNGILMQSYGSGYTRTPTVTLSNGGGTGATARATLKIDNLYVVNGGSGYTAAPTVTITSNGAGSGAGATTRLAITGTRITAGGTGYTAAPTVTFSKPTNAGGVQATGTAVIANGQVTGITITNPGSGYASAATVSFTGGGGTGAKATSTGSVQAVVLDLPDPTNPLSKGGAGYDDLSTTASEPNNPAPGLTITFSAPPAGGTTATAGATGKVFDITLTNNGTGYTSAPSVSVVPSPNEPVYSAVANANPNYTVHNEPIVTAVAAADTSVNSANPQGSILVKTKAIQELFDPTYGRLNATFGVEIPFTSALTQTTIPLGYVDVPTEEFANGETQIWKITHNGVDTHPIHFHLLNVQLINRVGWDNFITPPEPNELGWKETIKMSPLEDVIVAVRAKRPVTPGWGVPDSYRLLDPSQPEGAMTGFTQIDPNTGTPAPMANTWQNFGWEYVWHCHILGHEENDFMRPIAFRANDAVPLAASGLAAALSGADVVLSWTDNALTEYAYRIERAPAGTSAWAAVGRALANATTFTDLAVPAGTDYIYRVVAVGASGETPSNVATVVAAPAAPTALRVTADTADSVSLAWTDVATNETSYLLSWTSATGAPGSLTLAANSTTGVAAGLAANTAYAFSVAAQNANGAASAGPVAGTTAPQAVTGLAASSTALAGAASVNLSWTNANPNLGTLTSVVVSGTVGGVAIAPVTLTGAGIVGAGSAALSGLAENRAYALVVTVNGVGGSAASTVTGTTATSIPAAPTGLSVTADTASSVSLAWADAATNESAYVLSWTSATAASGSATLAANSTAGVASGLVANTAYSFTVAATNAAGAGTAGPVTGSTAPTAVTGLTAASVAAATTATVNLGWTNGNPNLGTLTSVVVSGTVGGVAITPVTLTGAAIVAGGTQALTGLAANAPYALTVTVTGAGGSAAASVTGTTAALLATPTGLTGTIVSATSIQLNWVDASNNETSFTVWRSDNGAAPVQIGTVTRTAAQRTATGGAVTFTNNNSAATPLVAGHTYTYAVYASTGTATSAAAIATVPFLAPAAPAALNATVTRQLLTDTVTLSWAAVPGATSYTVQRRNPGSATWTTVANNTTALTFTQAFVIRNASPYTYQIRANNVVGSSAFTQVSVIAN